PLTRTASAPSVAPAQHDSSDACWPRETFGSAGGFAGARDGFAGFAIGGAAALGFALVPELLAAGEGHFHFHPAVLKVHACGDEREAALLGFADQLAEFLGVDQELAGAQRVVVVDVAVLVGADVSVQQPELAVFDQAIGVFEVDTAAADRLDLGAGEYDAGLDLLGEGRVVRRSAVDGDVLNRDIGRTWGFPSRYADASVRRGARR